MSNDKLKPGTKAFYARQNRWRHNSFFGHAGMMAQNCRSIMESNTATVEAKTVAAEIYHKVSELKEALKTRKEGT